MRNKHWIVIGIFILALFACNKYVEESFKGFLAPEHFPKIYYDFNQNPITSDGFKLGKKLFYDPILSRNNTISCGTCHIQTAGFTQHGHDLSHGIDDRIGQRNSLPIMNLAFMPNYNWDGGVFHLDLQPIIPITTPEEMDESLSSILEKLQADAEYPKLFEKVFGSSTIQTSHIMKALSQFMLMCVSDQSKYDSVQRGLTAFNEEELAGYTIFQNKCGSCHTEPLFTDHSFRNNGIGIGSHDDLGRYAITLNEEDRYKFRVPSLRNLQYTAPYMHDGRYYNLDAVLDHYTQPLINKEGVDSILLVNADVPISLNSTEKKLIKVFLQTLNDPTFIKNPLFSEF